MTFLFDCYINKNTEEIKNKLINLGYEQGVSFSKEDDCIQSRTGYVYGNKMSEPHFVTENYDDMIDGRDGFDCGTNEDLFFAIAALRKDTDKNQWFIIDTEVYNDLYVGDWFIATDRDGGHHVGTQIDPMYCHKATLDEIVEHFK